MRRCINKRLVTTVGVVSLIVVTLAGSAVAEERPDPVVEFAAGWVGFADDGVVNEGLVGGTARFYLSPRISVGPEVAYISGQDHSHLMLTGNLTWDVLPPTGRRLRRVNPFVVVGGGLFQTREEFFNGPFTSNDGAFTAGGGVRALVGDRVTVGVDARIGWELHLRVSGLLGVQLGR
jgi:Outer membrane protein beta-barrel domain